MRTLRDMVRIQLCGRFAVVIDGQAIESRLPGRQGRLLVGYLAAHLRNRLSGPRFTTPSGRKAAPRRLAR